MLRVAVTGGIGSGKSTACAMFAARGVAVYDSDSAAKRLMNESAELRSRIVALFGERAYGADGAIDRAYLASVVFSDDEARARLNGAVHPAVMADFDRWCGERERAQEQEQEQEQEQGAPYVIFESAILFESGLADRFDVTVAIVAPLNLRIERTCRRDSADPAAVERRIAAQMTDDELCARADYTIVNIEREALADDVSMLDGTLRKLADNHAVAN